MNKTQSVQYSVSGKTLTIFCVVLNEGYVSEKALNFAKEAFDKLVPYIKNENQVLYIRDLPFLAIKGQYPSGHCYNPYEAMIALMSWQGDEQQIKATINHELHHMARWQNAGYGDTLGGAILSEGIATYYEELQSDWVPPWAEATVSNEALQKVCNEWDTKNYSHRQWFFNSPYGEWTGYGIGYHLAKTIFKDRFDLAKSILMTAAEAKAYAKQLR